MFATKACESRGIPLARGPKGAYVTYAAMTRDTAIAGAEGRVKPIFIRLWWIGLLTRPSSFETCRSMPSRRQAGFAT
jgi:hypothetical protein